MTDFKYISVFNFKHEDTPCWKMIGFDNVILQWVFFVIAKIPVAKLHFCKNTYCKKRRCKYTLPSLFFGGWRVEDDPKCFKIRLKEVVC